MLDKLSKPNFETLEYLFNRYCMLSFNRIYPLTLNNVKKYFEESVLYFFHTKDIEVEKDYEFIWEETDNNLTCTVNLIGRKDVTSFIFRGRLINTEIMENLNDFLEEIKTVKDVDN